MTIDTTQRFPLDHLLQCGRCGTPMHLEDGPDPAYVCTGKPAQPEACETPSLRAEALNRHLVGQVLSVIITDVTFDAFRAAVGGALAEAGHDPAEADELCQTAASVPEWLLTAGQAPEGGAVFDRFIDRIRIEPGTAEVEYKLPLPPGTPMAGKLGQTISLPESVLA